MKLFYLAALLLLSACATHPALPTTWAGFHGPAYLAPATTRRPPQRVLDSLARAAHRPQAHLLAK